MAKEGQGFPSVGLMSALAVFSAVSVCAGAAKTRTVTKTVTIGASACSRSTASDFDARNFDFGLSAAADVDTTRRGATIIVR